MASNNNINKPLIVGAVSAILATTAIIYILNKERKHTNKKKNQLKNNNNIKINNEINTKIGSPTGSSTSTSSIHDSDINKINKKDSTSDTNNNDLNNNSMPKVVKERLIPVLNAIVEQMGAVMVQLAQVEQRVRQESVSTGRTIPEDQLSEFLMGQFEEAMRAVESQIYKKHDCTEDDVSTSTNYYTNIHPDEDVKKSVKKVQDMYSLMTGQPQDIPEIPDDLTLDKFLNIMEETMECLNVAMEKTCKEVKELGNTITNKEEAINEKYIKKTESITNDINQKFNVTREHLQGAMMTYQSDPKFLEKMTQLQIIQHQRFTAASSIFEGQVSLTA